MNLIFSYVELSEWKPTELQRISNVFGYGFISIPLPLKCCGYKSIAPAEKTDRLHVGSSNVSTVTEK